MIDEEETGELHLAVKGTEVDEAPSSAIRLERIKTFLDKSEAIQKILILDCHYRHQPEEAQTQLGSKSQGKYIISNAPEAAALAEVAAGSAHSPLTHYLLEGLEGGEADQRRSGKVSIEDCYVYLQRRLQEAGLPEPMRWRTGAAGDWVLMQTIQAEAPAAASVPAHFKRHCKLISEMLQEGLVIPFLGDGVVQGAQPAASADGDDNGFAMAPLERELAQRIAKQAEFPEDAPLSPLSFISLYYQLQMSGSRLFMQRRLRRLFPQSLSAGPAHRFFASMQRPMLVLTSCYDHVLEDALRAQDKPFAVVAHIAAAEDEGDLGKVVVQYSDHPREPEITLSDRLHIDLERWWVIYKLRGSLDLLPSADDEALDSMLISEEDYIAFVSRFSDQSRTIPNQFSRLLQQRMLLFLGFRAHDWNYRTFVQLLRNEDKMRKVEGYAIGKDASDFEQRYWESKKVHLIDMEETDFVNHLAREMPTGDEV